MNEHPSYFKSDFRLLLVLVVLMAGLLAALWYFESTQSLFTKLAQQFLTAN